VGVDDDDWALEGVTAVNVEEACVQNINRHNSET
jgi:hypothetical protein